MKRLLAFFLTIIIGFIISSCDPGGSGPDLTPVTVNSIVIDESGLTLDGYGLDDALPPVSATVTYSDGTTDTAYTTSTAGDTTSFGTVVVTVTADDDSSVTDSIIFTVNKITSTAWFNGTGVDHREMYFYDNGTFRMISYGSLTGEVDPAAPYTQNGFSIDFGNGVVDGDFRDGIDFVSYFFENPQRLD